MRKKVKYTGYISKQGNNALYKIVAKSNKFGKESVKLEGFGKEPFSFWVDKDKLCDPPPPIRREGEQTQTCWECGCDFTFRECAFSGGEWNDSYCGC
jgi:hypothetical protein